MTKMTDSALCALIDRLSKDAIGADDYYSQQREKAMEFYLGEAKGELSPPEIQGRSRVVSKDLMDTVEWAMPSLMRMFASADDICRFEPETPEDEQRCEDATQYIGYLIHRKNNGFTVLHDAIKSALITRMGVIKVWCDKSWDERTERYQGLSELELAQIAQDEEVEISEQPEGYEVAGPDGLPQVVFDVVAKRRKQAMNFRCDGVPPEEIRISKNCRDISNVEFICHEVERTRSDLISEGWPRSEVNKLPSGKAAEAESEQDSRRDYDGSWEAADPQGDRSQELVCVSEAYLRVDTNGDGVAEYRRVVKAGTYVHENEETDDHPFALGTPILMPYKVIGLGFYDLVEDLMRIKTALMRQILDNVYLSNAPMRAVQSGQVKLDDLLQARPGGVVQVKSGVDVRTAIQDLSVPFVAGAGLEIVNLIDQVRDTRTGVTEMNSALNAESLAKGNVGSEGVQALMQAGAQRLELVARVFSETLVKRLYLLMLKLVTQYQDRQQQVKINGRWLNIDPREWKNRYDMTVSVGVGNASKQQQVANLTLIGQAQREALGLGLATPQNVFNTLSRLAEAMGYKDSDQFFTAPDPNNPPNQGPPPEVQLEQVKQQGKMQQIQFQAQADAQVAQLQQEYQAQQAQQEQELRAQKDRLAAESQAQLKQYEIDKQIELELAKAHIQRQTQLDIAQINAQASLEAATNRPVRDDRQDGN